MTLVFDIETDGLLLEATTVHCIVAKDVDTKEVFQFDNKNIEAGVELLQGAGTLVGHNILGFDLPVLSKLCGLDYTGQVVDTLILAKLAYYDRDRSWSHSLDAYGKRLGCYKGSYTDWSKYTQEMMDYCVQDVEVTHKLFTHLKRKVTKWLPPTALQLEQDVQKIVTQQYINGWKFDVKKAKELHVELVQEKEMAEEDRDLC